MSGEVSMEVLAKQCGTSLQMIEQHYSHVVPKMFTRELSGVEVRKSKPKKKTVSPAVLAKNMQGCQSSLMNGLLSIKARVYLRSSFP